MDQIDEIANRLAPHYSQFNVAERLLFSGHSHQAWPDVALEGLKESFAVSASKVDTKWETAFKKTEVLRNYLRNFYDDPHGYYCLAENTHLLLVSWLSSFDLRNKPKIITTDGEFHSMFRQLHRLREEGLEICMVDAESDHMARDIQREIDEKTCAVMLSRVFFETGLINRYIPEIARITRSNNIPLLIDDYHGTNVVPLSLLDNDMEDVYLLIGGYKYLQWGEGNCFLRFPEECRLRPAVTGWFASFNTLDKPRNEDLIQYDEGDQRFATGTYDSASQFRAAEVVAFFDRQGLTPSVLHRQYRRQVKLLRELFLQQNFDPSAIRLRHTKPVEQNGGFLSLQSPEARKIRKKLLSRGVYADARGTTLRLGPAPYITTAQIEEAVKQLSTCITEIF